MSLRNPRVTVLMPVFNAEEHLRATIDSMLQQTFHDYELLIVNDGSTDGSQEILRSVQDPRVRLLENERNRGLVYSLNRGMNEARGDYLARMDADDIAVPLRLQTQVEYLDRRPWVGVVGSWYRTFGARDITARLPTSHAMISSMQWFAGQL